MPGLNAISPPQCIASTGDQHRHIIRKTDATRKIAGKGANSNFFHTAELSADGTTIVTHSEDQRTRTFVLPTNLLEDGDEILTLAPYATSNPIKIRSSVLYPNFRLDESGTTVALQARTDLSIRLVNVLDYNYVHASYPWINSNTEEIITPHALLFSPDGTRFVAGAEASIAVFDLSRDNEGPLQYHRTRRSRKIRQAYGESDTPLSGILNALAINPSNGWLSAGSTERQIGFWDAGGIGEKVSAFSVKDDTQPETRGCGITQLGWSICGTYLFVAERNSDVILVFDMRQGKRLCWLKGRNAMSMQRMSFEIVESDDGRIDVWAGGVDGHVRVWENITRKTDGIDPSTDIIAHQGKSKRSALYPFCLLTLI